MKNGIGNHSSPLEKVAEALFSDSGFVAAGKRRDQRESRGMTFAGCLVPASKPAQAGSRRTARI
jgi:hypothetical protein